MIIISGIIGFIVGFIAVYAIIRNARRRRREEFSVRCAAAMINHIHRTLSDD